MKNQKSAIWLDFCLFAGILSSMHSDFDHLVTWFQRSKRPLPWRDNPSPYAVWVSEVMLQQTQVAVVIPYFQRWMNKFPTIQKLAESPLEEVIKSWEGLGYYSRARSLHEGAKHVIQQHGGQLPATAHELAQIKGLGDYTVGAILSFAFHQKSAAVDGNVLRVIARYFAIQEDIAKTKTKRLIQSKTLSILPDEEPWVMMEALLELGATICQKKPACLACPLQNSCQAHLKGLERALPIKTTQVKGEKIYRAVAIFLCQEEALVQQVSNGKIMAGLYEFPYFELKAPAIETEEFKEWLEEKEGWKLQIVRTLPTLTHSFTRYQATLFPVIFNCLEKKEIVNYQWQKLKELDRFPFSSGHRQILPFLQK